MAEHRLQSIPTDSPQIPFRGLSDREAARRRAGGLGNDIELKTSRTYQQILRENLFTFFNVVLFGVSLVLLVLGSPRDAFFTVSVAFLNVTIATIQEVRAKRKLDHINLLTRPKATVIRRGQEKAIDPSEIVVGDILVASPGDQIVVDGRLVGEGRIDVDESLLSGEPDLVPKKAGESVYSGSFCVTGRAYYEARRVGAESLANRLTEGARAFTRYDTPLQREVDLIIRVLLLFVAFFGVFITLSLVINEEATLLTSMRAASVVFGLAPSSLFLTIVVAYAAGALRIANKGALVQQANSVESLCHVTVLCLDKTGTLTTNRIQLEEIELFSGSDINQGDIEKVLSIYAGSSDSKNRTVEAIEAQYGATPGSPHDQVPFASERSWSALTFTGEQVRGTYVLGAPELLQTHFNAPPDLPTAQGQPLTTAMDDRANRGWRVLAFGWHPEPLELYDETGTPRLPKGLRPLCLLSFSDELRPEARKTLANFAKTGIELKLISGDNPQTVATLARQAGLGNEDEPLATISGPELAQLGAPEFAQAALDTTIFGRITPEMKKMLVLTLRENGHYVAMTGDGVNDVLALKQANLGIAMESGSHASRNVSDIILLNDSFVSLPLAFIEGQRILNGMEDIFRLYMTRILSLVLLIAMIAMLAVGFPFTPSQSSIIAILTLSIPAFALALWARPGPVHHDTMTRRLVHFVLPAAITMSAAGLIIYLFFVITTGDTSYAQLTLTYAMVAMGLFLIVFVEPPSKFWVGGDEFSGDYRPTILAACLFIIFLIALRVPELAMFIELTPLDSTQDYLFIGLIVFLWLFAVRHIWRAGLVDRYLRLPTAWQKRQKHQ